MVAGRPFVLNLVIESPPLFHTSTEEKNIVSEQGLPSGPCSEIFRDAICAILLAHPSTPALG